jgi:hypothetical protein
MFPQSISTGAFSLRDGEVGAKEGHKADGFQRDECCMTIFARSGSHSDFRNALPVVL